MTERECAGVFAAHNAGPTATYRLLRHVELVTLCSGCASEAMSRTVLDRRADPARPDRGSRWPIGAIGRRLLGLAR